ncbi:YsnF/AvaK domain-containing protein [Planktothrix mougeotii]|uniref:DUF2382 domain-containing protein n=1 Tax=Planktothrix mougeotii LEGE 06226 TaxID=1828728 RepID=A0ABR9UAY4_9CYAN|nr:DUF2382 domain-containing protein [Planktothrix mougeotii]MBE9143600.1 DUF2382 domain-containing protein [Planktothrix mougeotii LEGE 06226]
MAYSYPEGYHKNRKVEQLAKKLNGCWIQTLDGEVVGQVIDVISNAKGKVELVVPLNITPENRQQLLLLKANLIKQTHIDDRLLFIERTPELEPFLKTHPNSSTPQQYFPTPIPSFSLNDEEDETDSTLPLPASENQPNIVDNITIPLKEEKLIVERERRKVGEVVIRKQVETYFVQVPVKREKLVIEQVGTDDQILAEIPLSEETIRVVKTENPDPQ